jgi:hypothetical protein
VGARGQEYFCKELDAPRPGFYFEAYLDRGVLKADFLNQEGNQLVGGLKKQLGKQESIPNCSSRPAPSVSGTLSERAFSTAYFTDWRTEVMGFQNFRLLILNL